MTLADDERARVPFALLGAFLLASSAVYAGALGADGPLCEDRDVDVAMDRANAQLDPALRTAVADAARAAARRPVTDAAATPAGRALNDTNGTTAFRDALRLRVYLAAVERLDATRHRRGDVAAAAHLPAVESAAESDLRAAKRRVRIEGVANGTALRVAVRNVSVVARQRGRIVAAEDVTPAVTVATPTLALHRRAARFDRRLDRGPLAGPGLGRRLTARLYPVVWARGYAQFGGAPIENVLANRHVEVATNDAALRTQRAAFGRSDPDGRRDLRRAALRAGATDLLAPALPAGTEWADLIVGSTGEGPPPRPSVPTPTPAQAPTGRSAPEPDRPLTVGVNRSADEALAALTRNETLDARLRRAYRVEVRLSTTVERTVDGDRPPRRPPGEGWRLDSERIERRATVVGSGPESTAEGTAAAAGDRRFGTLVRRVAVRRTAVRTWRRGNRTAARRSEWTDRYRVEIAIGGSYAPNGSAPDRPAGPLFERGGALGGPNLADVPDRAVERALARNGGADRIARAAVASGGEVDRRVVVHGRRPDGLAERAGADLAALRARAAAVTVDAPRGRIATGAATPAADLAATLRDRRERLLGAPRRYDGAAGRALASVRAAYLDALVAALDRRAAREERTRDAFERALREAGLPSVDRLDAIREARTRASPGERRRIGGDAPGGPVALAPDGRPGYLTLTAVSHEHAATIPPGVRRRPLAARNVNLFTVPYGDAADAVAAGTGLFDSTGRVDLRTAGRTLVAADRTLERRSNATLRDRRNRLREEVERSLDAVRSEATAALRSETDLPARERETAVAVAFDRWDGAGRRALAASNGSLAGAVAAEARGRADGGTGRASALRVALDRAVRSPSVRVPRRPTSRAAETARAVGRKALTDGVGGAVNRSVRRAAERTLDGTVPALAGLPVAPVPGYWYATVNVWHVTVRGTYPSFVVRARRGPPGGGGAVRYVRDGSTVELDVDGDGDPERLGESERIGFETETAVAIAVPPGGRGVGDADGDADERSAGWERSAG